MRRKGAPIGFKHDWNYKQSRLVETKVAPGTWKIFQGQSKRRNYKSPVGSGAPVGSTFRWHWDVTQVMHKVDKDSYRGYMKGTKKLIKARIARRRRR